MRRVIGLGILLVGMSVTAEGVMEVEEPVTVVDGDHLNVVFTVPDATSWSWKLVVTAGSGWRHIDGTQTPSSGDWVPDAFSGNPGYWKSATVDDNSPWRNFQQPFHGKLSPVGEGPGEAYIGEYDIDAVTDSEYFVLPTINYVCAGKEVTLTAYSEPVQDPDNPPPTVNSTWEINKTDGITPDPFPDGHSVTFTASEPDEYTVKGESTSDTELTDSAQVNVIKVMFESADIALHVGAVDQLGVNVIPDEAVPVITFSSSNTDVVIVSGSPPELLLTGETKGTATIKACYENSTLAEKDIIVGDRLSLVIETLYLLPEDDCVVFSGENIEHTGIYHAEASLREGAPDTIVTRTVNLKGLNLDFSVSDNYALTTNNPSYMEQGPVSALSMYSEDDIGQQTGSISVKLKANYSNGKVLSSSDSNTFFVETP